MPCQMPWRKVQQKAGAMYLPVQDGIIKLQEYMNYKVLGAGSTLVMKVI